MFCKIILALTVIAIIVATGASPAAAKGKHHPHFFARAAVLSVIADEPSCYLVKKPVLTPFGWRKRLVEVCDY
jgi:hypothetical protein